jgi:hypothetical protein
MRLGKLVRFLSSQIRRYLDPVPARLFCSTGRPLFVKQVNNARSFAAVSKTDSHPFLKLWQRQRRQLSYPTFQVHAMPVGAIVRPSLFKQAFPGLLGRRLVQVDRFSLEVVGDPVASNTEHSFYRGCCDVHFRSDISTEA